jgi:carboxypeptidase D
MCLVDDDLFFFSPYIANYIYELPDTAPLKINLQGILIFDPSISSNVLQSQIPAVPFVHTNQNIFNFNASFLSYLDEQNKKCNYENYTQLYATYPPSGPLPIFSSFSNKDECDLWDAIFNAALIINPAFNIYRITDTPPILWDVLGFPGSFPNQQSPIYFARSDVQAAIHAPNIDWTECAGSAPFIDGIDQSPPPVYSILPNVIEKSQRTIIANGQHDFIIIAEGTRISIQNMSWNGAQGFQVKPTARFIVPTQGDLGFVHTERGLTYVEVALSGHMVPQFQ